MVESILVSIIILFITKDKHDTEEYYLQFLTLIYCFLLTFRDLFNIETFCNLYLIISSCSVLLLVLMIRDLETLLSSISIIPFKLMEITFYANPFIIPDYLVFIVFDMESWYLYGLMGLFIKNSFHQKISTKRTVVSSIVAFILSVPYINYFI